MPKWRLHFPKLTRRRVFFSLVGAGIGLAVPLGVYLLRYSLFLQTGRSPLGFALYEIQTHPYFYLLLTIAGTSFVGAFGFYAGAAGGWLRAQNEALVRLVNRMAVLQDLNRRISSTLDSKDVLTSVVEAATRLPGGDFSQLLMLHPDGKTLETKAGHSSDAATVDPPAPPTEEALGAAVLQRGQPIRVAEIETSEWREAEWARKEGFHSYLGVPLAFHNENAGVLHCFSRSPDKFTESDVDLMEALSAQAATAIRNAWLHDRLAATSAERYQVLAETATDGVILTDAAGRITFFNSSARSAFGYSEDEARRMAIGGLLSESSCEKYLRLVNHAIESTEPAPPGRTHVMEGLRSDGSAFPLEVSLSIAEVDGRIQVTGIYRDITERLEAQEKLEEMLVQVEKSRADILSVLNQLRLGTAMTDADGGITFLSQVGRNLFRKTQEEVLGKHWEAVFPFQERDKTRLKEMFARPSAERARVPMHIEAPGGKRYWIDVDVKDHPRDPQRKIFFLYDISEVEDLRRLLDEKAKFQDIVGKSRSMNLVYQRIREVSKVDSTVLIEGQTGTGKEMVARAIHASGHRKDGPFVAMNCAGLTESLLESQLFGHKRGAFTGATEDHRGLFETANGGTIFLDEIGDVPAGVQTRLLRVLQEREITRVGESRQRKIDVRVLAATQWDLDQEVADGAFRADLLYRIRVARIRLPPLHERREDIPLLIELFIRQCRAATAKPVQDVSVEAMSRLLEYAWPGNVRELQNTVEFAVVRCKGSVIHMEDLPPEVLRPSGTPSTSSPPHSPEADLGREQDEDKRLLNALEAAKGNRTAAARLLGISRATFYRRLSKLGRTSGA